MLTFCGKVIKPERLSFVPFSNLEGLVFKTNPFGSPSAPEHGNAPAALYQVASHTLLTKSKLIPAMGVADGPAVTVGPGVAVLPVTLISTQKDFVPPVPIPNGTPELFLSFQYPR